MTRDIKRNVTSLFLIFLSGVFTSCIADDGYLKVKSNIENVQLSIDGKKIKTIGLEWDFVELSPGNHKVTASKEYYPSQVNNVKIESSRVSTLEFIFKKADDFIIKKQQKMEVKKRYGSLSIISDIPGASVKLNGVKIDEVAPLTIDHLAEGKYNVELIAKNNNKNANVNVMPDPLSKIYIFFNEQKKQLHINKLKTLKDKKTALEQKIKNNKEKLGESYKFICKNLEETSSIYQKIKDLPTQTKQKTFYGTGERKECFTVEYVNYEIIGKTFPKMTATVEFDLNFGVQGALVAKMPTPCIRNIKGLPNALRLSTYGKALYGNSKGNKIVTTIKNISLRSCQNELSAKIRNLYKLKKNMEDTNSSELKKINSEIAEIEKKMNEYQNFF